MPIRGVDNGVLSSTYLRTDGSNQMTAGITFDTVDTAILIDSLRSFWFGKYADGLGANDTGIIFNILTSSIDFRYLNGNFLQASVNGRLLIQNQLNSNNPRITLTGDSHSGNIDYDNINDRWLFVDDIKQTSGTLELASGTNINEFSTDTSLGGNSDNAVPTEKAVKTYIDNSYLYIPIIVNAGQFDLEDDDYAPCEMLEGTNRKLKVHAFDRATVESVRLSFIVPENINTSQVIKFKWYWKPRVHPGTSEDVVWAINSVAKNDGEDYDSAFVEKGTLTSGSKTTSGQWTKAETTISAGTLGWAAEDEVTIRFDRKATDANDTMDNAATSTDDDALLAKLIIEIPISLN